MLTYGFYNSQNGDRKYNAVQLSSIFDGIITDGILATYGSGFDVVAPSDNTLRVLVNTGRAWFNHTWTLNDGLVSISLLSPPDPINPRVDTICIQVDMENRRNDFVLITGTPAPNNPQAPDLGNTNTKKRYPLANILVRPGVTRILASDIYNRRGYAYPSGTPFCTGVLQALNADSLLRSWDAQWVTWFTETKNALVNTFNSWYDPFKASCNNSWVTWFNTFTSQAEHNWDVWFTNKQTQITNQFNTLYTGAYNEVQRVTTELNATLTEAQEYQSHVLGNLLNQFYDWFEGLQVVLDGDVAAHLANEIETLRLAYLKLEREHSVGSYLQGYVNGVRSYITGVTDGGVEANIGSEVEFVTMNDFNNR